jgi:hypothetical protein
LGPMFTAVPGLLLSQRHWGSAEADSVSGVGSAGTSQKNRPPHANGQLSPSLARRGGSYQGMAASAEEAGRCPWTGRVTLQPFRTARSSQKDRNPGVTRDDPVRTTARNCHIPQPKNQVHDAHQFKSIVIPGLDPDRVVAHPNLRGGTRLGRAGAQANEGERIAGLATAS